MATPILPRPTADDVIRAEKKFDQHNDPVEWVLTQLFERFPENTDIEEVTVKTKVLNALYGTRILAVKAVAEHITKLEIDRDLKAGKAELVDRIAKVKLKGGKIRHYFSFASKYCSWHNPTQYPIYDSNVEACLWYYRKQDSFDKFRRYGYTRSLSAGWTPFGISTALRHLPISSSIGSFGLWVRHCSRERKHKPGDTKRA